MRQYLLDSAPLAAYLKGRQVAVDLISPWITRREVATSILVYGEITEYLKGLSHFSRRHAQRGLTRFVWCKNMCWRQRDIGYASPCKTETQATKGSADVVVELILDRSLKNLRVFLAALHEALAVGSRAHSVSPV